MSAVCLKERVHCTAVHDTQLKGQLLATKMGKIVKQLDRATVLSCSSDLAQSSACTCKYRSPAMENNNGRIKCKKVIKRYTAISLQHTQYVNNMQCKK